MNAGTDAELKIKTMDITKQTEIIKNFTIERHELMAKKGEDYNGADVLGLFKQVAAAGGRKPTNVVLDEVHKKVLRLQNLMQSGKVPNHETVMDSVTDLANYADLLYCTLFEVCSVKFVENLGHRKRHTDAHQIVNELARLKMVAGMYRLNTGESITLTNLDPVTTEIRSYSVTIVYGPDEVVKVDGHLSDISNLLKLLQNEKTN